MSTSTKPRVIAGPTAATVIPPVISREWCEVGRPTSRRFYIHQCSFGSLLAAQPSILSELGEALALSAASRAAEQVIEDLSMFGGGNVAEPVRLAVLGFHAFAAEALQSAFQCLIQLVPPRFGATEILLGEHEQINAWCYEDGYFTYATDEDAARVMYAETGSLRELRSRIRRTPEFDVSLQMISGPSLFLYDHEIGVGAGTARSYKMQHNRLARRAGGQSRTGRSFSMDLVEHSVQRWFAGVDAGTVGLDLVDTCLRRAAMTVDLLLRSRFGSNDLRGPEDSRPTVSDDGPLVLSGGGDQQQP